MKKCLGITDGSAGMAAQVNSLAKAMELSCDMHAISLKKPWCFLPNIFYDFFLLRFVLPCTLREKLHFDDVDILISCGRKAALVAAAIKRENPGIKVIHIQDPQMSSRHFDVVLAMEHDKITGDNVIKTRFALHNITPDILGVARAKFAPVFEDYPKPHIAVLLGGSTNKYSLTAAYMEKLIAELKRRLEAASGSLLITPSRRTGEENIVLLKAAFAGNKNVYIYDGKSENPYTGILACADEIAVTNDSVNMMSEAFATGKKIDIINLEGHCNTKPARFAEMLKTQPQMTGNEMRELSEKIYSFLVRC